MTTNTEMRELTLDEIDAVSGGKFGLWNRIRNIITGAAIGFAIDLIKGDVTGGATNAGMQAGAAIGNGFE